MFRSDTPDKPLIMLIGMGNLSINLLTLLLADASTDRLVLAGRDVETCRRRANLARFTAFHADRFVTPAAVEIDLRNVERTSETLARVKPDIIFMGASLQSWRVITQLPSEIFEALDEAQFGPWLPMHLTLNHLLMRAVRDSGIACKVVNAAFPDAVGPVLAKVGLAPTIGIGNVANIVPALSCAVASLVGEDPGSIELRLVAQHYFSHYVPRFGNAGRGAYRLSARVRGRTLDLDKRHAEIFGQLTGPLKRLGGIDGQLLTAASAARVIRGLASGTPVRVHAPAPGGLPGGYPVRIDRSGVTLDLDDALSLSDAIAVNEACQRADGIEHIDEAGTVTFSEPEMAIMRNLLHYNCRAMELCDAAGWAQELGRKYQVFANSFRPRH